MRLPHYVRDDRGMAFIAAFSIYAILMVLTITFVLMTDSDLNIAVNHRDTIKALYLSEAGIEYGIWELFLDWNWAGTGGSPKSLGDGTFEVAVTEEVPGGRKEVLSTGICQQPLARGRGLESKRKIKITMIPPAFRYTVFSTRTVQLIATTAGSSGLVADPGPNPAYVHSNSSVDVLGNVNVTDATITQVTPAVSGPNVDMTSYQTDPRTNYVIGGLIIDTANQGSYQDKIFYRTDRITVNANTGNITLNGTTLVTEEDIRITGTYNVTINPDYELLNPTAYPSMVALGRITTTASFTGYIYAKLLIYSQDGLINLRNLRMDEGSVISGRTGGTGIQLQATENKSWYVYYDDTILTNNKPKYFTVPINTAGLLWTEVYN